MSSFFSPKDLHAQSLIIHLNALNTVFNLKNKHFFLSNSHSKSFFELPNLADVNQYHIFHSFEYISNTSFSNWS